MQIVVPEKKRLRSSTVLTIPVSPTVEHFLMPIVTRLRVKLVLKTVSV